MRKGLNKAIPAEQLIFLTECINGAKEYKTGRPCIFISHRQVDAKVCEELATYIKDTGVDIFFDKENKKLRDAASKNDSESVTAIINNALILSSHMIVVISENTKGSWWVPYEIGFTWNKQNFNRKNVVILIVKGIKNIPEYLFLVKKIEKTEELDAFLKKVAATPTLLNESFVSKSYVHPMKEILI